MGIILAFGWLGHAAGGYQGALAFEMTSNYATAFIIGAAAGVINLLLVGILLLLSQSPPRLARG
jgi:hypothetical protein